MIRSFKDGEAAKIDARQRSKKLPSDIQQVAFRKMRILNNAMNLNDLRIPPANRLEKLSGDGEGHTAFESTTNGVSVSSGGAGTHVPLRLRIITREVRL